MTHCYCGSCMNCYSCKKFNECAYCEQKIEHGSGHGYYCSYCDFEHSKTITYKAVEYKALFHDDCLIKWKNTNSETERLSMLLKRGKIITKPDYDQH